MYSNSSSSDKILVYVKIYIKVYDIKYVKLMNFVIASLVQHFIRNILFFDVK